MFKKVILEDMLSTGRPAHRGSSCGLRHRRPRPSSSTDYDGAHAPSSREALARAPWQGKSTPGIYRAVATQRSAASRACQGHP